MAGINKLMKTFKQYVEQRDLSEGIFSTLKDKWREEWPEIKDDWKWAGWQGIGDELKDIVRPYHPRNVVRGLKTTGRAVARIPRTIMGIPRDVKELGGAIRRKFSRDDTEE